VRLHQAPSAPLPRSSFPFIPDTMKRLLAALLFLAPLLAPASTLRDVLAFEAPWTVAFPNEKRIFGQVAPKPSMESAHSLFLRIVNAKSDSERALAVRILKTNWKTLEENVITPALSLDTKSNKPGEALWVVLKKIAESPSVRNAEQTELKRILDSI